LNAEQFKELTDKLDMIAKLIAINILQGKTVKEQVKILSSLGFRPVQIATLLGKSQNYINVLLHELRKESPGKLEEPK